MLTPWVKHGTLNGTTPVTIVDAPASSEYQIVRTLTIYNRDTANVEITIKLVDGGSSRYIAKCTLAPGETWVFGDRGETLIADATTQTYTAVMTGAAATTNPDFTSHGVTEA